MTTRLLLLMVTLLKFNLKKCCQCSHCIYRGLALGHLHSAIPLLHLGFQKVFQFFLFHKQCIIEQFGINVQDAFCYAILSFFLSLRLSLYNNKMAAINPSIMSSHDNNKNQEEKTSLFLHLILKNEKVFPESLHLHQHNSGLPHISLAKLQWIPILRPIIGYCNGITLIVPD